MFHSLFQFSGKIQVFYNLFFFLLFSLYGPQEQQNPLDDILFFTLFYSKFGLLA